MVYGSSSLRVKHTLGIRSARRADCGERPVRREYREAVRAEFEARAGVVVAVGLLSG
jgi:hypothetical protein